MVARPSNLRCKSPRPIHAQLEAGERTLRHAYRWGPSTTPSPPPVVVSCHKEVNPEPEPPLPRGRRWPLLCAAAVLSGLLILIGVLSHQTPVVPATAMLAGAKLLSVRSLPTASYAEHNDIVVPPSPTAIEREGYLPISGGILITPDSFAPTNGEFDLIVHFHGDVHLVRESIEHANLNAALAIINLGLRSGPYYEAYRAPGSLKVLLKEIRRAVAKRGVRHARLRRLALTAWSAGYGAIQSLLVSRKTPPAHLDPLDAVIVLDGIHCGFINHNPKRLNSRTVSSFIQLAHAASQGDLMFSVTHSQIEPRQYASTQRTAELLLESVGVKPAQNPLLPLPKHLELPAAFATDAKSRNQQLMPVSDTRVGSLRVQGFSGRAKEHHAAHLLQMSAVALPDLAARWENLP